MARGDGAWIRDILAAIADIRADTAGMDLVVFSAKRAMTNRGACRHPNSPAAFCSERASRWLALSHHGVSIVIRPPNRRKSASLFVSKRVTPLANIVATILASWTCFPATG